MQTATAHAVQGGRGKGRVSGGQGMHVWNRQTLKGRRRQVATMPFDVRCTVKGSVSDRVVVSKWVAVGNRELVRLGVWSMTV